MFAHLTVRVGAISAILVSMGLALGIFVTSWNASAATAQVEPWPRFVMTYRETARNLGPNGTYATQEFRLEYTDRRHFRVTQFNHSSVPDVAGSTFTFDGDRSINFDAHRKATQVTPYGPNQYMVLADWLVPANTEYLARRPDRVVSRAGKGIVKLTYEESITTATSYPPGSPPVTTTPDSSVKK